MSEQSRPEGTANFADRLAAAIDRLGTPACVGLDPVFEKMPEMFRAETSLAGEALATFCIDVIDQVYDVVPAVKPQSACFERFGSAGCAALEKVIAHARARGLLVILDAKRGDIGVSAEHYAAGAFQRGAAGRGADALTVNPYLGMDTLEPYLAEPYADGGRGVFVLVRTSNPGSDGVQAVRLADGRTVGEMVADQVAQLGGKCVGARGLSSVGAVVGATKSAEAAAMRRRMPDQFFLIPGYGAQGGTLDDLRGMVRFADGQAGGTGERGSAGDLGILVNASRSVLYAFSPADADWRTAVRDAARRFADELRTLTR